MNVVSVITCVTIGVSGGGNWPHPANVADITKSRIESQPKAILSGKPGPQDPGKRAVEFPTKAVVARSTAADFINPKVEPGKIRWHADFATACTASQKSNKPVLLFHLMGNLDDQFC